MIRRPPRSTLDRSSAASDVYKRQKVAMWGTGIDITKVGSRNPGFNNVLRVSTKPRAAIALAGDISKGYIALLLLGAGEPAVFQWLMGIAAVAGHCWSPFL